MGQYYKPSNLTKRKWLYSHDIQTTYKREDGSEYTCGQGLKLMEHSYIGNQLMNAVEHLLMPTGAWHKNSIVWAGDYADPENKEREFTIKIEHEDTITAETKEEAIELFLENLSDLSDYCEIEEGEGGQNIYGMMEDDEKETADPTPVPKEFKYLTNHTKKLIIDLSTVKEDKDGWKIHPLSLYVCEGNGRGGGDFHNEDARIGTWARDIISLEDHKEADYKLLSSEEATFMEVN